MIKFIRNLFKLDVQLDKTVCPTCKRDIHRNEMNIYSYKDEIFSECNGCMNSRKTKKIQCLTCLEYKSIGKFRKTDSTLCSSGRSSFCNKCTSEFLISRGVING